MPRDTAQRFEENFISDVQLGAWFRVPMAPNTASRGYGGAHRGQRAEAMKVYEARMREARECSAKVAAVYVPWLPERQRKLSRWQRSKCSDLWNGAAETGARPFPAISYSDRMKTLNDIWMPVGIGMVVDERARRNLQPPAAAPVIDRSL
jgi:hypothetical protein